MRIFSRVSTNEKASFLIVYYKKVLLVIAAINIPCVLTRLGLCSLLNLTMTNVPCIKRASARKEFEINRFLKPCVLPLLQKALV